MSFQRRGWDIHIVSAELERAPARNHQSRKFYRKRRSTKGHTLGPSRWPMTSRS